MIQTKPSTKRPILQDKRKSTLIQNKQIYHDRIIRKYFNSPQNTGVFVQPRKVTTIT